MLIRKARFSKNYRQACNPIFMISIGIIKTDFKNIAGFADYYVLI
jgi:hypothetical protein